MSTDNLLTWNVHNWITVTLMFALSWLLVMGIVIAVRGKQPASKGIGAYKPVSF